MSKIDSCSSKIHYLVLLGVGYREGDIENFKGPQWYNLIIIQDNLPVNKMKTKIPKI